MLTEEGNNDEYEEDDDEMDDDDTSSEFDSSVYYIYHQMTTGSPCLSFDIIPDGLGSGQERNSCNKHTLYLAAGTQGTEARYNALLIMKLTKLGLLRKSDTSHNEEEEAEDDDDDEEDSDEEDEPILGVAKIQHNGCVNRVRVTKIEGKEVAATWSDKGKVYIWDLTWPLAALEDGEIMKEFIARHSMPSLFTFSGHLDEGYAMDWSQLAPGVMATGDCCKDIHLWNPLESGWHVNQRPLIGHSQSVEDLHWSPNEINVLASCSMDKTIKLWDVRTLTPVLDIKNAHEFGVDVLSWNEKNMYFLLSGGDDASLKIWDLRKCLSNNTLPIATFKHHLAPITSVEWNPADSSVFAASGEDDQITLWDLAVEKDEDEEEMELDEETKNLPPQLLFVHKGQTDIKELHWHEQIAGLILSTAQDGFNIFKTINS